jgi:SnoaL-like protein
MGRGEENVAILRRLDELFHEAGVERVLAALLSTDPEVFDEKVAPLTELFSKILDPEVEVDLSRGGRGWPNASHYRGIPGWIEFWAEWLEPWSEFAYRRPWSRAIGDAVVSEVLLNARGAASGLPVEWHFFQLWRFRNGRLVYLGIFDDMQTTIAAAAE